ncbi:hypothetical protein V4842_26440 [Pseudomonas moraviensis]|uniref:Uncharacterized protein n=2 Tax=Pseudomonas fluorescens TaxID=294 RepID=K0WZY6_PSEFL|nr:hypothetical protein I1A_000008 [Pseudomonas fluorescens R124]EJZ60929.1 Hypothetical protein I1A_000008 [Pseudomonas fluorescens R124]
MGVASLKKGAGSGAEAAAASPAADSFINGAKIDGKNGAVAAKPAQAKVYKRIMFSLSSEIDAEVERLSLLPHGIRVSRSDVIRAAVALLAGQGDEKVSQLLRELKEKD